MEAISKERLDALEALAEAVEVPGKTRPKSAMERKLDMAEAILTIHQAHHKPQDEAFTWVAGALSAIYKRYGAVKPEGLDTASKEAQAVYWKLVAKQRAFIIRCAKKAHKA